MSLAEEKREQEDERTRATQDYESCNQTSTSRHGCTVAANKPAECLSRKRFECFCRYPGDMSMLQLWPSEEASQDSS